MSDDFPGTEGRPVRVAVVGSGPAGFYTIAALFKQADFPLQVDLFDRLPTPFGLVRGGVAPDHPKIKGVIRVYDKLAGKDNFRFFGNVRIGRDLSVAELQEHYDQIVFATGNEAWRNLGIPGEDLAGVHSATEFVGWYNGHPDFRDLTFDLENARRVIVVGNGNVAMDVTRILAEDPKRLETTDIAEHALEVLRKSRVEEILILGRRGPAQAAFTNKEIKEIGGLSSADLIVDPADMELDGVTRRWMTEHTTSQMTKNVDYLTEHSRQEPKGAGKRVELRMLVSPVEFHESDGRLGSVVIEKNELFESEDGTPRPRGSGVRSVEEIQLSFSAVGYRGLPVPGVPFNERRGLLANQNGRIWDPDSEKAVTGLYTTGWAKRGPTGLIGSNVADANETVERMLEDLRCRHTQPTQKPDGQAIGALLKTRGVDRVTYADWRRLDAMELERGSKNGKIREKFTRIDEMMSALRED